MNDPRFPCEVRVRATPLLPCRRHGKKRNGKDIAEDEPGTPTDETAPPTPAVTPAPPTPTTVKKESGKKSTKNQSKQVKKNSIQHCVQKSCNIRRLNEKLTNVFNIIVIAATAAAATKPESSVVSG